MNRRRFIQSLVAVFSLPSAATLSIPSGSAAISTASAVPTQARFWSIYMSALHGECPPHALQAMANIPAADAKKYISQLITEGVIKPNPLLKNSVSKVLKSNEDSLLDKVKKRSEMKAQAKSSKVEISEIVDQSESLDGETELQDDFTQVGQGVVVEDELAEEEIQKLDETTLQS